MYPQDNIISFVATHLIPTTRAPFVNSSFAVFESLQVAWGAYERWNAAAVSRRAAPSFHSMGDQQSLDINNTQCPVNKGHLQTLSALYRKEIRSHLGSLVVEADVAAHHDVKEDVRREMATFEAMHGIWYLCEVVLLSGSGGANTPIAGISICLFSCRVFIRNTLNTLINNRGSPWLA